MSISSSLTHHYNGMMSKMPASHVHSRMMAAKSSLIHSAIPSGLKMKMVNGYRSAEHSIFGSTTNLPGESDLGVSGLNMGQRVQLRRGWMNQENKESSGGPEPDNSGQSDLIQSMMAKYSPNSD